MYLMYINRVIDMGADLFTQGVRYHLDMTEIRIEIGVRFRPAVC